MISLCLDQSGRAALIGGGSQSCIVEIIWGQEEAQPLDPLVRKAAESWVVQRN